MATLMTGYKHELSGNWTISGVVEQLEPLSESLRHLTAAQNKRIHVDCRRIESIDMSGLQLLHVWMECVKMHGIEAKLINLPDDMHQSINRMGIGDCFSDNHGDAAKADIGAGGTA